MPPEEAPAPAADDSQFTLEEWIAATQACCGISHDDDAEEQ